MRGFSLPRFKVLLLTAVLVLQSCGGNDKSPAHLTSQGSASLQTDGVTQLIVKFKVDDVVLAETPMTDSRLRAMSEQAQENLEFVREAALNKQILRLPRSMTAAQARVIADRLQRMDGIAHAEPDTRDWATTVPNDPGYQYQWSLNEPEKVAGGMNVVPAWDVTLGSSAVVIAVIDSGVLPHADLVSNLLPGYDFVKDLTSANDGSARDSDASDPGTWVLKSEAASMGADAKASASGWHGTIVAGIAAASINNATGTAGVAPRARILPVRALGKGNSGQLSDIADAMVWAAGGTVPGVPANPNPARVINMSLGSLTACSAAYQDAIDHVRSLGAVVVVAAGNESVDVSGFRPANCSGVIAVGATTKSGALASYSNFGSGVTVSAPGGDSNNGIYSTADGGLQGPLHDNLYRYAYGTSMATPAVSGVVALMLSVNPALSADQVRDMLKYSANRFPVGTASDCTTLKCGTGIANALGAVRAASSGTAWMGLAVPHSGWWWNAAEGGRGYAIEIRNGNLFMAGFQYETTGSPTWFVSTGSMTDPMHYVGQVSPYQGGQTLLGAFHAATPGASLGQISLSFAGANQGSILWPGGQVTPITRFDIDQDHKSASFTQSGFTPEAGWWWNAAEPGRGFAIEVQGNNFFVAGFMYDNAGKPTWYVAQGNMTGTKTFLGNWVSYANGQAMGGTYKTPSIVNSNVGSLRLEFSDPRHATMTLPDGRTIEIGRFLDYGVTPPIATTLPSNRTQVNSLFGNWNFNAVNAERGKLLVTLTDLLYLLSDHNVFVAGGKDDLGNDVRSGYIMDANLYWVHVYKTTGTYDDWYQFSYDPEPDSVSGLYFKVFRDGTTSAKGEAFTGVKVTNTTGVGVSLKRAMAPGQRATLPSGGVPGIADMAPGFGTGMVGAVN